MGACFKDFKPRVPTNLEGMLEACGEIIDQIGNIISMIEKLFPEKKKQIRELEVVKIFEYVENLFFYIEVAKFFKDKVKKIKEHLEAVKNNKDFQSAKNAYNDLNETKQFLEKCQEQCNKKIEEETEESKKQQKEFMKEFFEKNEINKEEFDKKVEDKVTQIENNKGASEQDGNQEIQWGENEMTNEV
jgi:hypothetical protein